MSGMNACRYTTRHFSLQMGDIGCMQTSCTLGGALTKDAIGVKRSYGSNRPRLSAATRGVEMKDEALSDGDERWC